MEMLHNEQSQCVFAQSKHPIMAVIHMYSLTGRKKKATMRHCNSSRTNDNSSLLKSSGSFKKKRRQFSIRMRYLYVNLCTGC